MKTEELIVQLTRSLEPVQPLARPSVRLMRWSALSLAMGTVGVLAIGARGDLADAVRQPAFVSLAILALATGIAAAACALVLSVPGAERSPVQRRSVNPLRCLGIDTDGDARLWRPCDRPSDGTAGPYGMRD